MVQTGHDIKKNIPGTDEHAIHNPTRGTGGEGIKSAVKVRLRSCWCLTLIIEDCVISGCSLQRPRKSVIKARYSRVKGQESVPIYETAA